MKKYLAAILLIFQLAIIQTFLITAIDPSAYTPSARVLGLGRAYVGLADDAAGIYINPAGIAKADNWKVTSMSGKFVEDYDYLSVTGIYPTNYGVIGIGYDTYSIGGAPATTIDATSDPLDPIPIIDPTQQSMSNYNSVIFLSFANTLDKTLKTKGIAEKISVGANLKIFSTGLSGDHISNGSANGSELDLGILFQATPFMSLGASALNALPASLGGKLSYVNGHEENFPALIKIGTALNILGAENAVAVAGNQKITGLLDFDYSPTLKGWPLTYHAGIEWLPIPMLAVRAGMDQIGVGNGAGKIESIVDFTMGVGVMYSNLRFDYAYHQFGAMPGIDNHTFSLSFDPASKKAVKKSGEPFLLELPEDKTTTYSNEAQVKGIVLDFEKIKSIAINKESVQLSPKGSFLAAVPLKEGKNKISVSGLDKIQVPVATEEARLLRYKEFPDVPDYFWARQQISLISMLEIVTGYPDGSFRPDGNITRAEMAALLMRSKGNDNRYPILDNRISNIEPRIPFKDIKSNHWAAGFIADAASAGVVEGYPDQTFKPQGNITRAEGLAMIARFAKITQEAYVYQYFPDVESSYWASTIIAGASKAGLLEFLRGKNFVPKRYMTRAEAVEILYRTPFVEGLLEKDLLNWDGY